jgi:hypothetical protein
MNDKIKVTLVSKAVAEAEAIISCQLKGPNVIQFASDAEPWVVVSGNPPRHELGSFKMYPEPVEIKPADKD